MRSAPAAPPQPQAPPAKQHAPPPAGLASPGQSTSPNRCRAYTIMPGIAGSHSLFPMGQSALAQPLSSLLPHGPSAQAGSGGGSGGTGSWQAPGPAAAAAQRPPSLLCQESADPLLPSTSGDCGSIAPQPPPAQALPAAKRSRRSATAMRSTGRAAAQQQQQQELEEQQRRRKQPTSAQQAQPHPPEQQLQWEPWRELQLQRPQASQPHQQHMAAQCKQELGEQPPLQQHELKPLAVREAQCQQSGAPAAGAPRSGALHSPGRPAKATPERTMPPPPSHLRDQPPLAMQAALSTPALPAPAPPQPNAALEWINQSPMPTAPCAHEGRPAGGAAAAAHQAAAVPFEVRCLQSSWDATSQPSQLGRVDGGAAAQAAQGAPEQRAQNARGAAQQAVLAQPMITVAPTLGACAPTLNAAISGGVLPPMPTLLLPGAAQLHGLPLTAYAAPAPSGGVPPAALPLHLAQAAATQQQTAPFAAGQGTGAGIMVQPAAAAVSVCGIPMVGAVLQPAGGERGCPTLAAPQAGLKQSVQYC